VKPPLMCVRQVCLQHEQTVVVVDRFQSIRQARVHGAPVSPEEFRRIIGAPNTSAGRVGGYDSAHPNSHLHKR
jgi:hypothetical protein